MSRIPVNKGSNKSKGKPSFSFFRPSLTSDNDIDQNQNNEVKPDIIKDSIRTSPPPDVYVDGFIVGNIPSGNGQSLVRNDDGVVDEISESNESYNDE